MLTVLSNRTYWHLFLARMIALLGTELFTGALGLLPCSSPERKQVQCGALLSLS